MLGAASSLTPAEFAEIVGACIAVVALGLGGIEYRIRRLKERLSAAERRADAEAEERAMLSVVVERGMAGTISSVDFVGGWVQRLAEERGNELRVEDLLRVMGALRSDLERSWMEARLMSGQVPAQLSALQQLTQRLGDKGTTGLLKRGAESGSFGGIATDTLLSAAAAIERREEEGAPGPRDASAR